MRSSLVGPSVVCLLPPSKRELSEQVPNFSDARLSSENGLTVRPSVMPLRLEL